MASEKAKIKTKKIRLLRALAAKVFKSDENYHDWLANTFEGKESTLKLTVTELNTAISLLFACVGKKGSQQGSRYQGSGINDSLTQKQANMIAKLEDDLGWQDNPQRLRGFIEHQTGQQKSVEMLRNREASKVINGMIKMREYQEQPA